MHLIMELKKIYLLQLHCNEILYLFIIILL